MVKSRVTKTSCDSKEPTEVEVFSKFSMAVHKREHQQVLLKLMKKRRKKKKYMEKCLETC